MQGFSRRGSPVAAAEASPCAAHAISGLLHYNTHTEPNHRPRHFSVDRMQIEELDEDAAIPVAVEGV